jgi:hypothetical protein
MTISNAGVNINDNLGVINGMVGIGTAPHATYKLDVLGDINASGAVRVGGTSIASKWATNASGIGYSGGNVGINATPSTYKLEVNGFVKSNVVAFHAKSNHGTYTYTANTRITGVSAQGWDAIMVNNTAWNASTGVFTAPYSGVYFVCCSCYLASNNHAFSIRRNATSSTTGDEYAGAWIGTGSGVVATDRSYFSAQAIMNIFVADTISVWSGSSGCAISNAPANSISIYLIMPT